MTDADLDDTLLVAQAIAREAGLLVLASYRTEVAVSYKGAVDPVTTVDIAAEEVIRRRLAERYPDHSVLAEEGGLSSGSASLRWLVDPLDGTVNYTHGHPFFAVSLALEAEGAIVVAVVHAPALGLTWTGRKGAGTRRNGSPARVSRLRTLDHCLVATGFPYDRWSNPDNNLAEWGAAVLRAQGTHRCGSAALDLCLVSDGTYDAYWEKRLSPWDMAAGVLLVEEAGGRVSALDGTNVPPYPATVVATNGLVHDQVLSLLRAPAEARA
jgi:myo-inositol-1(or 4)-monophosphatase